MTAELDINIGGEPFHLTEENTTVYRFREAAYMDHAYIIRPEQSSTVLFAQPEFFRQLIDLDFPLQTARWPRQCDFVAYDTYIDMLAAELTGEIEGLDADDTT